MSSQFPPIEPDPLADPHDSGEDGLGPEAGFDDDGEADSDLPWQFGEIDDEPEFDDEEESELESELPLQHPYTDPSIPPITSSGFRDQIRMRREVIKQAMDEQGEIPFEELPAVKFLKEAWKVRGIDENDPVFLLVEVCAYWDERSRERIGSLSDALALQEAANKALLEAIRMVVNRLETHEAIVENNTAEVQEARAINARLSEQLEGSHKRNEAMTAALRATVDLVGERTLLTQVLQYAIPLLTGVVGVLIGLLLKGFFTN